MNHWLPNDYMRCYGEDCDRKLVCLRYQTMKSDPPNVVRSYTLSMIDDNGQCDGFIDMEKP